MFNWRLKATNAIYLEDSNGQEGRPFKSRFLQAGLVKYDFGVCLLKKETIDKFVNTFVECPVIINHKDDIAVDDVVGTIQKIWFNSDDGWFWCSGVITHDTAIELIEKGYNVSCQYRITEYSDNDEGKLHNANPYDKEILDGVFEHLAIVENPRYEDAFIAVNAYIAKNNEFNEKDHPRDDEGKFTDRQEVKEQSEGSNFFKKWENAPTIALKPNSWDEISDIKELRNKVEEYLLNDMREIPLHKEGLGNIRFSRKSIKEFISFSVDRDKLLAAKQLPEFIKDGKLGEYFDSPKDRTPQDTIKGFYPIYFNFKTPTTIKKAEILIAKDNNGNLFFDMFLDYDRDLAQIKRALNGNHNPVALNNSITDSQTNFNPNAKINIATNDYTKVFDWIKNTKGEFMDTETKNVFSQLLEALKARNEAEEDKDKKEEKDDKATNEDVDKRKLIDEIGGILKGKVDEEVWRTIIGKIEKVAYDKSEAGTADNSKAKNEDEEGKKEDKKADEDAKNKCKNEEEKKLYEELKEKVEKEAENQKAKNALDDAVNLIYSAVAPEPKSTYVSQAEGLALGKQIYG